MAGKSTDVTEPEVEAAPESAPSQFVVTADAVTLSTGVKKSNGRPEVVRVLKGGIINAPADHESIVTLLESRCIAVFEEGKAVKTATARLVTRALGGQADPVQAPRADVQPIDAPASV